MLEACRDDLCSFGELLKGFRQRQRFTQQDLAAAVGVHRNAIGRWELGDFLPSTRGMVFELANQLQLDDQETLRLLEASLTTLAPHWQVPFPRNPFFTGRAVILEALHEQLGVTRRRAYPAWCALQGLAGVGKTQIALEYVYRYALEYRAVFWIAAETGENVVSSFLRTADVLQLPGKNDQDQQRIVASVQHWLRTHSQWLLVWDNIEDLTLLDRFLPTVAGGAILLTTCRPVLGNRMPGMTLLPMELEDAASFLLRRAKLLPLASSPQQEMGLAVQQHPQYAAARELAEILGKLPLALDQAGAYLEETQCGLPAYLDLFRTRRAYLLHQRGEGSCDHPESVFTTFALAITATAARHPEVRDLLRVCALLHPDAIPEELFHQGGSHLGAPLQAATRDVLNWNQLVAVACSSSLLSRQPEEQTFAMHRMVQAILLDELEPACKEEWTARVLAGLNAVFPEVPATATPTTWKQCERLLPHVLVCLQRTEKSGESLVLALLAYKTAQYLRERGRYAEALPLYQRALRVQEQLLGTEQPEVASTMNYLALLYFQQGKYEEALPLYQHVLSLRERVLSADHPDLTSTLNNLAILFYQQGKYTQAEICYRRALHIGEQTLGPEHPQVALSFINLAILFHQQAKYAEAEALLNHALRIEVQALGPEHPHIASIFNTLASIYWDQGRGDEAEPLYWKALKIREQVLGPEHPHVASTLHNLADLCRDQSRNAEAKRLYRRALKIWTKILGPDHPRMASSLNGLAILWRGQGKYMEAEALFQRALTIREQRLGLDHPDTAQTLHDLAILSQKQGNLIQARVLSERASDIYSKALGTMHPQTIAVQALQAQLVQTEKDELSCSLETEPLKNALVASQKAFSSEPDPLQAFLTACCELHPRACERASDLWQAYKRWAEDCQERFPLSRRAFAMQLKTHGCCPDRTSASRTWQGIALATKKP